MAKGNCLRQVAGEACKPHGKRHTPTCTPMQRRAVRTHTSSQDPHKQSGPTQGVRTHTSNQLSAHSSTPFHAGQHAHVAHGGNQQRARGGTWAHVCTQQYSRHARTCWPACPCSARWGLTRHRAHPAAHPNAPHPTSSAAWGGRWRAW